MYIVPYPVAHRVAIALWEGYDHRHALTLSPPDARQLAADLLRSAHIAEHPDTAPIPYLDKTPG